MMVGQTDEALIRDALREMRQVLMEMVEYMPDRGGNEHKARWEQGLNRAYRSIGAIRGDKTRAVQEDEAYIRDALRAHTEAMEALHELIVVSVGQDITEVSRRYLAALARADQHIGAIHVRHDRKRQEDNDVQV